MSDAHRELSARPSKIAAVSTNTTRDRRREVVRLWLDGLSNVDIAERLGVAPHTIANDLRRIPAGEWTEREAVLIDARSRLVALHRIRRVLQRDAHIAIVRAELDLILGAITQAESVVKGDTDGL